MNVGINDLLETFDSFSSWPKLLRVITYLLRFVQNGRKPQTRSLRASLSCEEIENAKMLCIKLLQIAQFGNETKDLQSGKAIKAQSRIAALTPYLDERGVLRVGDRLHYSLLPETAKHPVILPRSKLAKKIVLQFHKITLHGRVQLTLRVLRQQFWIILYMHTPLCAQLYTGA